MRGATLCFVERHFWCPFPTVEQRKLMEGITRESVNRDI